MLQEMDLNQQPFSPFNNIADIWGPNASTNTAGWNFPKPEEPQ